MLSIHLLGPLEVFHDGTPTALPPSRKTRALLGYLAVAARAQRRERLCELFWEVPDDPRGALRWSLSKLRGLLDRPEATVVQAGREAVSLALGPERVDYLEVREVVKDGIDAASTEQLKCAAARFRGAFLEGLDLPQQPELQAWLVGLREEARRLHAEVLATLDDRLAATPEKALPYARELVQLDPLLETSWARLLQRLAQLGRRRELEEQTAAARTALSDVGGATRLIEQTIRQPAGLPKSQAFPVRQEIRFCHAPDGVRLAYAIAGEGPPLVKAPNWLNHLEFDWESPIWGHLLRRLAGAHRLLRFDARGNGLSDRDPREISLEAWVRDLETVVDAAGYERFPLLGISQGGSIAIAYAVRHPERVSHLVLYGTGANLVRKVEDEEFEAMRTLIRLGWGRSNPALRQMFTTALIPDATRDQANAFNELQKRTATPEIAARHFEASRRIDIRSLLHQVRAPTLVLHARGDAAAPVEGGRLIAASIPGARFAPLPGQNHLFLEDEPIAEMFFEEMRQFLNTA